MARKSMEARVVELEHQVATLTALVETLLARPHLPIERKRQDDFDPFPRFHCYDNVVEGHKISNPGEIMCCERQVEWDSRRKTPDELRREGLM